MLGALVGDCIGAGLEFSQGVHTITERKVQRHVATFSKELEGFSKGGSSGGKRRINNRYTDDSAMAKCIAEELLETREEMSSDSSRLSIDGASLARRFALSYEEDASLDHHCIIIVSSL